MKYIVILLFLLSVIISVNGQEAKSGEKYVLEMLTEDASEPAITDAVLSCLNDQSLISVRLPEGDTLTTIYKIVDNDLKFQLSSIRNDMLRSIHFIGKMDSLKTSCEGHFSAMVEGKLHPGMVGRFSLKKKEE